MSGGFLGRLFGRGQSSEQRRPVRRARPSRPATTCSRPSTGSSRWSPAGRCPRRSPPGCARVDQVVRDTIPRLRQPRRRQPAGLLGDGDRHRLPARGGGRLPAPAAPVRRQPPGRQRQVLADGAHRPARPARRHDGQGLRRRVPRRRRRPRRARPVPGREVRRRLRPVGRSTSGRRPLPPMPGTHAAPDAGGLGRLQPPAGRDA